ncbi:hypothetical protein BV22DRAFT_911645 [Leucogyrophana mollusca]|uniref:Uncharacterized protein n=1 Tax=Leucogyrophana mollusca TaxID=85980 RepID=A0ACB8AY31_9AGAM|nr:hypothetical protein BV22DRAFT_911645 [Leucogyrophana mollusca]
MCASALERVRTRVGGEFWRAMNTTWGTPANPLPFTLAPPAACRYSDSRPGLSARRLHQPREDGARAVGWGEEVGRCPVKWGSGVCWTRWSYPPG